MYNNFNRRQYESNRKDKLIGDIFVAVGSAVVVFILFSLVPNDEELAKQVDPKGYAIAKKMEEKRDELLKGASNAIFGKE
jgi:hypothetical protein